MPVLIESLSLPQRDPERHRQSTSRQTAKTNACFFLDGDQQHAIIHPRERSSRPAPASEVPEVMSQPTQGVNERPSNLGEYVICCRLGTGGFGTVYLAFDQVNKRPV